MALDFSLLTYAGGLAAAFGGGFTWGAIWVKWAY